MDQKPQKLKNGAPEELYGENEEGYRGFQTKTRSGFECMRWADTAVTPADPEYSTAGLDDNNYCRNPQKAEKKYIWCFKSTTERSVKLPLANFVEGQCTPTSKCGVAQGGCTADDDCF